MATSRVGKSVWAMKAQLARFVIFQTAMLIALAIFMTMDVGWLPAGLIVISVIAGLSLSDLALAIWPFTASPTRKQSSAIWTSGSALSTSNAGRPAISSVTRTI
jgi:hypothetical protein